MNAEIADSSLLPRDIRLPIAVAIVLTSALVGACYSVAGASLGLYIGGFVVVTILLPPLTFATSGFWRQLIVAGCVSDVVGIAWLISAMQSATTFRQWIECYLVLCAYSAGLFGISQLLRSILRPILASATMVVIGLLWLTWPIWMSHALLADNGARLADWLVPAHPIFAVNRVLDHLGYWTQQGMTYRTLVNLGQDVPYAMPKSSVPSILVHCAIAIVCIVTARAGSMVRSSAPAAIHP